MTILLAFLSGVAFVLAIILAVLAQLAGLGDDPILNPNPRSVAELRRDRRNLLLWAALFVVVGIALSGLVVVL